MLYEVMRHVRNFFPAGIRKDGLFTIKGGTLSLPFVNDGNYILIEGSIMNDGVYQYPLSDLTDEEFNGCISVLAPPKEFIELCNDIKQYKNSNIEGAFVSESFGGYSYTRATNKNGNIASWQEAFSSRLKTWRKI